MLRGYWSIWILARAFSSLAVALLFALFSSDAGVEIAGIVLCVGLLAGWEMYRWRAHCR